MSQFPIDDQLVERADYAYNPKPEGARVLYACDCRKEVERLQEQVRVLREALLNFLDVRDAYGNRSARAVLAATEERP